MNFISLILLPNNVTHNTDVPQKITCGRYNQKEMEQIRQLAHLLANKDV